MYALLSIRPIKVLENILTLSFLPSCMNMINGNINSNTIKFKNIEIFFNLILAAFVNIIDFFILSITWIPIIKRCINYIYRCPDLLEKSMSFVFGGSKGHRNFITHSIFNPVFLIYIYLTSKLCKLFINTPLDLINRTLFFSIGLCFTCHLISDTMPKHWKGFANVKVYLFTNLYTFSPVISKSWLYIGSFLSFALLYKSFILL